VNVFPTFQLYLSTAKPLHQVSSVCTTFLTDHLPESLHIISWSSNLSYGFVHAIFSFLPIKILLSNLAPTLHQFLSISVMAASISNINPNPALIGFPHCIRSKLSTHIFDWSAPSSLHLALLLGHTQFSFLVQGPMNQAHASTRI
jgi:hypothetical protein